MEERGRPGCATMGLAQSCPPFAPSAKGLCQHGHLCVLGRHSVGSGWGEEHADRWTRESSGVMPSSAQPQ